MLKAQIRQPRNRIHQYRREGKLLGVIYGHNFEAVPILLDYNQFIKEVKKYGEGALFDIEITNQEPFKVLWQDYQKDPLKQQFVHVDLYRIRMDEKLTTKIPLIFIGEASAVKNGGVLVKSLDYLEVECLPKDLVPQIEVNLAPLDQIHSSLKVSDITIPPGIMVLNQKEQIIVGISAPATEVEEEVSAEEEAEAIEALGKKEETVAEEKKEGEPAKVPSEQKK